MAGVIRPVPPPYDAIEWSKKPFDERAKMVCAAWAMQGYGTPLAIFFVYALKVALYVGVWIGFCSLSPALGGPTEIASWWLEPIAFQKAIVWSMLFEVLGLGCGSGPLTGRYFPPIGGALYFLRPGTTKLPLFAGAPVIGAARRGAVDVLVYLALVGAALVLLIAPEPVLEHFLTLAILIPLAGVLDKTVFLAARAEHYWVTIVCFCFVRDWVAGAMAVQLALWFWAGFSKLNHHFPSVVCVMTSNAPLTRFAWLRRQLYRDYPNDLRPSRAAEVMAHLGTVLEMAVPIAFLVTPVGTPPVVAIVLMLALHGFITSNVPMGVPIEWNVMVVYGGFALFWAHHDAGLAIESPLLLVFLIATTVLIPLLGNLFPSRFSFLLAMRYYAGNWAYSIYLFRGDSYRKLAKMTMTSPWVYDQLARFYDRATAVGLVGKVMGFRLMHLHGRALGKLIPKAIAPARFEEYEWMDGEIVAGLTLGWNFGEGHLHQEQLLASIQSQCGFAPGELRCVFVEGQPFGRSALAYRIADAASGELARGELPVSELRARQPWEISPS